MADKPATSFAHQRHADLPDHHRTEKEAPGPTRTAFDRAGMSVPTERPVIHSAAPSVNTPAALTHVLPDPRPTFARPSREEPPGGVVPDRSVTCTPEEMKAAFVKARLGHSNGKVPRWRGR